jgi:hypothetical protein
MFDYSRYPHLAQFTDTYARHRRGKVEIVRKGRNRFKVVASKNRVRVAARGGLVIPPDTEVVGKLVGAVKRDRRNIKEQFQVGQQRGGFVVRGQGNLGPVQVRGGAFVGGQRQSYQRDTALMSEFPALAQFGRGRDKKKRKPKAFSPARKTAVKALSYVAPAVVGGYLGSLVLGPAGAIVGAPTGMALAHDRIQRRKGRAYQ